VKKRLLVVLTLAVALSVTGVLMTTTPAGAGHVRPKSALRLHLPLVPAFDQCTAPNRTHGPPLAHPSCAPPSHASDFLTVGKFSEGLIRLFVHVGAPGPPTDSEVLIMFNVSDVRCKAGTTACGNANSTGGADYTGELQGNATIRITDHYNATAAGGGTDPATVVDIPFPINAFCANTADTSIGASCEVSGGAVQPAYPDCSCEGKLTTVEVTQFKVWDGGADGVIATSGNTLFLSQGLFVP
jgi:hypothetical protein